MKRVIFATTVAMLALAGCAETTSTAAVDPITAAISGKTLVNDGGEFKLGSDGVLSGKAGADRSTDVAGTWKIDDGKFCRTLSKPEAIAGSECQDIVLGDDGTVTITSVRGSQTFSLM